MSGYSIMLFLHVAAALALFAALALEWTSLYQLRHAAMVGLIRIWLTPLAVVRFLGGPAMLVLLLTGISMLSRWRGQGWVALGVVGLILIGLLGGALSGRRFRALTRVIPAEEGPVTPALRGQLRDPVLWFSAWLRTGLGAGVVFLMTVKPAPAVAGIALAVSLLMGALAGAWHRTSA